MEPSQHTQDADRNLAPSGQATGSAFSPELFKRIRESGVRAMTDRDLLSLLVCGPVPELQAWKLGGALRDLVDGDLHALAKLNLFDLLPVLSERQAFVVLSAMELSRRRRESFVPERRLISTSREAFEELRPVLQDLRHEEFWLLFVDRGNRLMGRLKVSEGGLHGTVADPKRIFSAALERHASGIILSHNHPSGQLRPSMEDMALTKKLVDAGRVLDITVQDHLIVAHGYEGYFSFADNGQL